MDIAERVKALFQDNDVVQKDFAAQYNMGESTLSSYLNGKHAIPYDLLVQIADFFDVTMDFLFGRTGPDDLPVQLTRKEQKLMRSYRTLSLSQKQLVNGIIQMMRDQNQR